jgi:hypothetical protein
MANVEFERGKKVFKRGWQTANPVV